MRDGEPGTPTGSDPAASLDEAGLPADLAGMVRELLDQTSRQDVLDRIVAHAVKHVDGCQAASIMAVSHGTLLTVAVAGGGARWSERVRGRPDDEPSVGAATRLRRYPHEPGAEDEPSAPARNGNRVGDRGISSSVGFLLAGRGGTGLARRNLGSLNLYSSRRDAFGGRAARIGWVLASHAAVTLANAELASVPDTAPPSQLLAEAVRIVMARYRLSGQAAFERIRDLARLRTVEVYELAATITETGELPAQR